MATIFCNFLITFVPDIKNSQSNNYDYLQEINLSPGISESIFRKTINYLLDPEQNHKTQQISIAKLAAADLG